MLCWPALDPGIGSLNQCSLAGPVLREPLGSYTHSSPELLPARSLGGFTHQSSVFTDKNVRMTTPSRQTPYFQIRVPSYPVSGINPPCPPIFKLGEHPYSGFGRQPSSRATATVASETALAVTVAETLNTTTLVSSAPGPIPASTFSRQGGSTSGFYNQVAPEADHSGPRLNAQGDLSDFSTEQLLNIIRSRESRPSQPLVAEPDFGSGFRLTTQTQRSVSP